MKLNLGCGSDVRDGYVNVDYVRSSDRSRSPFVFFYDLSRFPWPWESRSAERVLMLDFLEHFPYGQTTRILGEVRRVLRLDGAVEVQVPDFDHCARAATWDLGRGFQCNACGYSFGKEDVSTLRCRGCGATKESIQDAAVHRLYGGQDRIGNYHMTAFTREILSRHLARAGFSFFEFPERNECGETYSQNWNVKVIARVT